MDKDKIAVCDKCLPAMIAQDGRTKTVRAFSWDENLQANCRCGDPALFELSR